MLVHNVHSETIYMHIHRLHRVYMYVCMYVCVYGIGNYYICHTCTPHQQLVVCLHTQMIYTLSCLYYRAQNNVVPWVIL